MNQQEVKALLNKYAEGKCTSEEKLLFEALYAKISDQAENDSTPVELQQMEKEIYARLPKPVRTKRIRLWPQIAAALAFIVSGVYFFNYSNQESQRQNQDKVLVNDVAPGQVGATLTLASGKKIRLTDAVNGQVAQEAGVVITKSGDGQLIYEMQDADAGSDKINTLSTANGETYQLRLPDGSIVWLNAASSITYAASLNEGGKRIVNLQGEAYFEVTKDKKRPFIVATIGQHIEVLGTHFNINAYRNEANISTTLIEGSVKIVGKSSTKYLVPGQQSVLNKTNDRISINEANTEEVTAWKNGYFRFNGASIESVMRELSRWYNVDVRYNEQVDEVFYGKISRSKNISEVLKMLEQTNAVQFKVKGKEVSVLK